MAWIESRAVVDRRARCGAAAGRAALMLSDAAAVIGAGYAVGVPRRWGWAFTVVALGFLAVRGHHRLRISPSLGDEAPVLVGSVAASAVLVALLAPAGARTPLLETAVAASGLLLAGRMLTYVALRRARARGALLERTLIIGAGSVGAEIARTLRSHPEYGLAPVGFVDSFDDPFLPLPVLGELAALDDLLARYGIDRVIIAFGATREPDMVGVVRSCDAARVDIHIVPRFFELGFAAKGPDVDRVWGIPLLRLRRSALRTASWKLKRGFDIAVSGLAILVLSPLLAALALAVRLTGPGGSLFRQRRVGQDQRPIWVLKFRSMRPSADSDTRWSVEGDERVTRLGRLLRRTSLDELPQLFNVLRGDMSLVGPRPERPYFVERYQAEFGRYGDRHRVPVGLTGWAQVHGLRGDTSIGQRIRFDNQYIENWSLWLDIVILLHTVLAVLRGSGSLGDAEPEPAGEEPEQDVRELPELAGTGRTS